VVFVELRDEARDQAFAHTALPLKGEVYGSGAFGGLRRVIYQQVRHQRFRHGFLNLLFFK
jgi:hypothetical protein